MVVYTELSALERDLGIPIKTLFAISNSISSHYRRVYIPKAGGGTRTLSVPDAALKRVQRAIATRLLAYEPVSPCAKAYRLAGGVRKNAIPHVGQPKLLKLDVYHFFESINYSTVKDLAFPPERYAEKIRILLAMLCYCGEALPQGAPTSPVISNIVMRDFDEKVLTYCKENGITYTRYCDDLTFSGDFDEGALRRFVEARLSERGFLLNNAKKLCVRGSARKVVTGVVVNEKPNTPRAYRQAIRQEVYYCTRFGTAEHLRRIGDARTPRQYLSSLLGRVSYALHINPDSKELHTCKENVLALLREELK